MKRPVYPATIAAHDALTDTLDGWPDLADMSLVAAVRLAVTGAA